MNNDSQKALKQKRVHLLYALALRCPYCGTTKLRAPGSWLKFRDRCDICHYDIHREPGYFWGASWMVNYPLVGVFVMLVSGWVIINYPDIDGLLIAAVASFSAMGLGLFLTPFGKALWLWFDHWIRLRRS